MQHKTLEAKIRVYSIEGEDFLLYKFKGKYYPISIVQSTDVDSSGMDEHTQPCPYKAAMVAQQQYAPFYSKQLKELGKRNFKLETTFTL